MEVKGMTMKKLFVWLTLLVYATTAFGQGITDSVYTKDYYLDMSHRQRVTGLALLGGGTALVLTGLLMGDDRHTDSRTAALNFDFAPDEDASMWLFIPGVIAAAVSVPYFVRASQYSRKATEITLTQQSVLLTQQQSFCLKRQPAITLRVRL